MEPIPVRSYNIGRLQKWLNYELSGLVLLVLSYTYTIALYLAVAAAIVFIPLLLKVLFQENRYGWLISFFLFIAAPPFIIYLLLDSSHWVLVSSYVSLGLFYFYCGLLKFFISEW